MENTYEEKLKECRDGSMKWSWVAICGMIPILATGVYMCINVKNIQLIESQSTIIFLIFCVFGIISAAGMYMSSYYSNRESALMFEETLHLLDSITLKVKENKK